MRKQFLGMVLVSTLLAAGCGDSAETVPVADSGNGRIITSGTFQAADTIPLPEPGEWVEVRDLNGDGLNDLVIGLDTRAGVMLNSPNGFSDLQIVSQQPGYVLDAADLNGDGFIDIVTSALDSPTLQILPGRGNGTFDPAVQVTASGNVNEVHVVDLDGDGDVDLATSIPTLNRVQALLNTGNFNYAEGPFATLPQPSGLTVADFNLDGRPDFAAGTDQPGGLQVILNLPGGLQQAGQRATASRTFSVTSGDYNGDGRPDVAGLEINDVVSMYTGDGAGGLSQQVVQLATGDEAFQVVSGDVNNDGFTDLVIPTRLSGQLNVFVASAFGGFEQRPTLSSPLSISAAVGDVNADGIQDIVSVTSTPALNIYLGNP